MEKVQERDRRAAQSVAVFRLAGRLNLCFLREMKKVVGIADGEPPETGPTPDQWTRELVRMARPLFRRAGWPLPPRGGGAEGVRARSDVYLPKHYKVDPHIEHADRVFVIRFPATEPTDESICRQIVMGLIDVASADALIRSGAPYESELMLRGNRYKTIRARSGLLDDKDNLTRIGVMVVTDLVEKLGHYPEGPSNRRPKSKKSDTIDLQCSQCTILWIPHYSRTRYEDVKALGGFRCPQRWCGGILIDSTEIGELFHPDFKGR